MIYNEAVAERTAESQCQLSRDKCS